MHEVGCKAVNGGDGAALLTIKDRLFRGSPPAALSLVSKTPLARCRLAAAFGCLKSSQVKWRVESNRVESNRVESSQIELLLPSAG